MDSRNDWKRASRPGAPLRLERHGNERRDFRDGNNSSRRKFPNNYSSAGKREYPAENYGNRMEDPNYNDYDRNDNSGYDSGYIDLNSAVDSIPGKKKRKRIIKENDAFSNGNSAPNDRPPYQKVVLKKKVAKQPPLPPMKKLRPVAPEYPDVVFDKPIRLNRFIANAGLCSRREADTHIKEGLIKVNGEVVTEMGVKVNPEDEILFKDKALTNQRKIYLLLNKPKGFVTSLDEPKGKKLVVDLVRGACKERIYPVGRLDKMTTGVLLFTNDGDLSLKLSHPSNCKRFIKRYLINFAHTV
jgi:23S rRNA pseudouridine2605 synthase